MKTFDNNQIIHFVKKGNEGGSVVEEDEIA